MSQIVFVGPLFGRVSYLNGPRPRHENVPGVIVRPTGGEKKPVQQSAVPAPAPVPLKGSTKK